MNIRCPFPNHPFRTIPFKSFVYHSTLSCQCCRPSFISGPSLALPNVALQSALHSVFCLRLLDDKSEQRTPYCGSRLYREPSKTISGEGPQGARAWSSQESEAPDSARNLDFNGETPQPPELHQLSAPRSCTAGIRAETTVSSLREDTGRKTHHRWRKREEH